MAKVMKSKKHKVAPKKVAAESKKVVLVGTYKSGQLEKWPGFYNYPICDGDKIEPEFATRVNEIWLFNAKKEPVCLKAKFVGFKTREELKSEFDYPAKGKPHGTGNYILYATSKTRVYSPASGLAERVIVRLQDFATSKSVQKKQMGSDGQLHLDLVKLGIVPDAINVKGGGQFYSDIHITSVTGRVEHEVGDIDPLKLDDLPDFLGDDDVVLDLANPLLFVTVENGLPATANTLLSLSATVGGVQTERATSSISVKPGHNLFMLADHDTNVRPAKYADATFIPVKDLGGIIRKIPEQVNITVAPVTVEAEHFPIPGTFPIDVDYEVWAPLSFGPDFRLVYQGTERGWSEDLGDLEDVDFECIEMVGQIDSDLPAAIHLSVEPLDCELRPLAYVEAIAVDVPSGAKNHPFTIAFRAKAGHTLNDVLTGSNGSEQLDGVRYKAVVDDPAADATLRAGAKVRLHDVHITIKGGITIDAN